MTKYFPISIPVEIKCVESDMISLNWKPGVVIAEFSIPGNEDENLHVTLSKVEVFRVLDEMPLSTEGETRKEGLIANHFAYRVEDSLFWESQSWALTDSAKDLKHYRFITGGMCLDVLAHTAPVFSVQRSDI
jgi:hypothetical protein